MERPPYPCRDQDTAISLADDPSKTFSMLLLLLEPDMLHLGSMSSPTGPPLLARGNPNSAVLRC